MKKTGENFAVFSPVVLFFSEFQTASPWDAHTASRCADRFVCHFLARPKK